MSKRPGLLEPLRIRVRRLQLILGLGLMAAVVGAFVSIPIMLRVAPALSGAPVTLGIILLTALSQLWVWAVLPAMLYGMARIIALRPWSSAIGSVVTGYVLQFSITFISKGLAGFTEEHPARLVVYVASMAAGILLGHRAVVSARAASARADEAAKRAAEAKKDEYAEFARAAERLAERNEAQIMGSASVAAGEPEPVPAGDPGAGATPDTADEPGATEAATDPGPATRTGST